ncbi:fasciclin domain-containing protein, partial [Flavobacteriales bacterium]|nr:fasciclin domain-containing protein [Flavobacteriales bacterium]
GMTYMIDMATVTAANIEASNGVVHVIDMVLIPTEEPELPSIMDIVTESEAHTVLEAAINAAGLNELLDGEDPFTLFAPTDDAFDALPEGTVAALLANIDELIEVLAHHVVGGTFMAEDLNDGDVLTTANDDNLTVTVDGMTYMIDMATVISANIEASNGVVHVIDIVLIPETNDQTVMSIIENSPIHTTLETAIIAAGLANTLSGDGSFTVFAPSDEVFAALPDGALDLILANTELLTNLLLGHVHEGELYSADLTDGLNVTMMNEGDLTVSNDGMTIMIDDAIIFQEDLPATNGVVHVIDNILPSTVIDPDTLTVMSIIEASPEHTTLEAAINAAELAETLSGEGPFTVFAPTDDAFALLPAGTVEGLLADIPALTEILLHHVVGATALSTDFNDGDVLTTLNTTELTVSVDDGTYIIDMATVTAANLEADNGVVHVINMVLIPADPSSINEFNTTDIYMYSLNLLGEKVDRNTKGEVIIDIYTNGKTVKRLNLNK